MNEMPWRRPWLPACAWAGSLLCLFLIPLKGGAQGTTATGSTAAVLTMKQALDAAWLKAPDFTDAQGRQDKARAVQESTRAWLAAPSALTLSQREGSNGPAADSRETQLGWTMPIWRFGQREAGAQASDSELKQAQAYELAARLRLLGELREAAGAARLAEVEMRQAEQQAGTLRKLVDDVERRVKAGDLAPADELAARAEWLAAQSRIRVARQAFAGRHAAWKLLTGLEQMPAEEVYSAPSGSLPESHPDLLLSAAAVEHGARRSSFIRSAGAGTPEVSVGVRQESAAGSAARNSVVVALRLPLGGSVHRQPAIAAALADLELARAQAQRQRERLVAEVQLASRSVRTAQAQLEAEGERARLLGQRAAFIDKAFRAGESSLPELLRALAAEAEAQIALARQNAALNLARARLEQSLGFLP